MSGPFCRTRFSWKSFLDKVDKVPRWKWQSRSDLQHKFSWPTNCQNSWQSARRAVFGSDSSNWICQNDLRRVYPLDLSLFLAIIAHLPFRAPFCPSKLGHRPIWPPSCPIWPSSSPFAATFLSFRLFFLLQRRVFSFWGKKQNVALLFLLLGDLVPQTPCHPACTSFQKQAFKRSKNVAVYFLWCTYKDLRYAWSLYVGVHQTLRVCCKALRAYCTTFAMARRAYEGT